jgi:hypothetical protein
VLGLPTRLAAFEQRLGSDRGYRQFIELRRQAVSELPRKVDAVTKSEVR